MCILYACTTYIYIHTCMCVYYVSPTDSNYVYYVYIYYAIPTQKNYIAPPKTYHVYIYIHDHDYICQRARFPQLPLLCFLVMLPVEQPLLTNGCSPTLGLLLMTSSFPCSTSYISPCIIYIYIKKESIGTTIYLCACFITF